MKRLSEFTKEEMVNLSDEQYEELIDLECMCAGAPLSIEKPTYKELPVIPEPDTEAYTVCGYTLTDKDEAEQLAAFVNKLKSRVQLDYDYRVGSEYKFIRKLRHNETFASEIAKPFPIYTNKKYQEIKEILSERATIKAYNDEVCEEYEERKQERDAVCREVAEAFQEAIEEIRRINEATEVYEKYLYLCNGDSDVAQNFFKESRYSNLLDKVLENIKSKEEQNNE